LTNLIKNGRLGKVMGTILNTAKIKLICGDNGAGEIKKHGMCLSTRKGLQTLSEMVGKEKDVDAITIMHVHNEEDASFLKRLLESKFGFKKIRLRLMRGTATLYAAAQGIVIAY
jgi:fatty acid-binding protein DegV